MHTKTLPLIFFLICFVFVRCCCRSTRSSCQVYFVPHRTLICEQVRRRGSFRLIDQDVRVCTTLIWRVLFWGRGEGGEGGREGESLVSVSHSFFVAVLTVVLVIFVYVEPFGRNASFSEQYGRVTLSPTAVASMLQLSKPSLAASTSSRISSKRMFFMPSIFFLQ